MICNCPLAPGASCFCDENLSAVAKPPLGPAPDYVDQPAHYARWKMQPVEFIAINNIPWWAANVIKYIMRFDAKDGLKDLRKARSYLDMKIREMEGIDRWWEKPVAEERRARQG